LPVQISRSCRLGDLSEHEVSAIAFGILAVGKNAQNFIDRGTAVFLVSLDRGSSGCLTEILLRQARDPDVSLERIRLDVCRSRRLLPIGDRTGPPSLRPLTVAVLTDHVFGWPASVGYALACTDGAGALAAIVAFLVSRRRFSAQRH
jgi:hypothetical protein